MTKPDPLKPGAPKLSSIWKRFAVSAALATVLVAGCASIQPNPSEPDDDPQPQRTEQTTDPVRPPPPPQITHHQSRPSPEVLQQRAQEQALREFARHVLVRRALLNDARLHFPELARLARTGYSDRLDSLQTNLTGTLQGQANPAHSRVFILDPAQFDVGRALGFTPQQTVSNMLQTGNVNTDNDIIRSAADNMSGTFVTPYGRVLQQEPSAFMNMDAGGPGVCVLVPSSDFAFAYNVPGLTPAQNVSLVNRHESWHCLDNQYPITRFNPKELVAALNGDRPLVNSAVLRDYVSVMHHKESLGDVGAIGDMIRQEGLDTTLIDKMIAWRSQQRADITHITVPALQELKSRIEGMGLEAFRSLDDTAAHAVYFAAVDAGSLSQQGVSYIVDMAMAEQSGNRAELDALNLDNPDYQKALVFSQYVDLKETPAPPHAISAALRPLSPEEQVIWQRVSSWNAGQVLLDRAFTNEGKITPRSLTAAYGQIQSELLIDASISSYDPVPPLQMAKLKQVFISGLQNLDYLQVNRERGVDIVAVEPALTGFRPPLQVKVPPVVRHPAPSS